MFFQFLLSDWFSITCSVWIRGPLPEARRAKCIGQASKSGKCIGLYYFIWKSKCKFINLIHTWQKNKIICSCSWKIINTMASKCHLTWKNINNFTQWTKWISRCDVQVRDHAPKHLAQSGHSTRSAVNIVNTLHVFKEQSENKKWSWSNKVYIRITLQ